nr:MAG TPA: hypothetical protein [Caudoviricetes sp.]
MSASLYIYYTHLLCNVNVFIHTQYTKPSMKPTFI